MAFDSTLVRIGVLTKVVADAELGGHESQDTNNLSLAAARLKFSGTLDRGFSYVSQFEFSDSPAVLDAKVRLEASPALGIDAGLFKVPYSAESLISLSSTDFVNRAQVVRTINRGRQVGVAIHGATRNALLGYNVGLFTGNGHREDGRSRLYVGRLTLAPQLFGGTLETGGIVAYSDDAGATRILAGGDTRYSYGRILLSAEISRAHHNSGNRIDSLHTGYQVTAGFSLEPNRHEILARWDGLSTEDSGSRYFMVLGYNTWPARAIRIQINYLIPMRATEPGTHRLLLNFQVAI